MSFIDVTFLHNLATTYHTAFNNTLHNGKLGHMRLSTGNKCAKLVPGWKKSKIMWLVFIDNEPIQVLTSAKTVQFIHKYDTVYYTIRYFDDVCLNIHNLISQSACNYMDFTLYGAQHTIHVDLKHNFINFKWVDDLQYNNSYTIVNGKIICDIPFNFNDTFEINKFEYRIMIH